MSSFLPFLELQPPPADTVLGATELPHSRHVKWLNNNSRKWNRPRTSYRRCYASQRAGVHVPFRTSRLRTIITRLVHKPVNKTCLLVSLNRESNSQPFDLDNLLVAGLCYTF